MERTSTRVARKRVETLAGNLKGWERKLLDETVEEHAGSIQYWPAHMAERLLSKHLRFSDRFSLTLFMLANKIPPCLIAGWMIQRKMLRDEAARKHVASIIDAHMKGELEAQCKTAYVMYATDRAGNSLEGAQKIFPVYTPIFAYDWQHQHYWEDAVEMLKNNCMQVFRPIMPDRRQTVSQLGSVLQVTKIEK